MKYDELYTTFKEEIPEGSSFFEVKEKENLIDETDGIHIVFGMVIVPYILYIVQNNKMLEINKVFSFLENMAICEDIKIKEVLDFTVLEQLVDEGQDILEQCKQYMKKNTLKHCEEVEKYFCNNFVTSHLTILNPHTNVLYLRQGNGSAERKRDA